MFQSILLLSLLLIIPFPHIDFISFSVSASPVISSFVSASTPVTNLPPSRESVSNLQDHPHQSIDVDIDDDLESDPFSDPDSDSIHLARIYRQYRTRHSSGTPTRSHFVRRIHIERLASDSESQPENLASSDVVAGFPGFTQRMSEYDVGTGIEYPSGVVNGGLDSTSDLSFVNWVREGHHRLAGWMAIWGEGKMNVLINPTTNVTVSHRPAAFPAYIPTSHRLPVLGNLTFIQDFPLPDDEEEEESDAGGMGIAGKRTKVKNDQYGCLPTNLGGRLPILDEDRSVNGPDRDNVSKNRHGRGHGHGHSHGKIALIVRGGCSFSQKVRSAQHRGAVAVVVADGPLWKAGRGGGGGGGESDRDRDRDRDDGRPEGPGQREEDEEEARRRDGLLTMYSPEDTSDIYIPSTFISRASYLEIWDLMQNHNFSNGLQVEIEPDESWEWPVADLLLSVMLLPSILTIITLLVGRYRSIRQRKADRATSSVVFSLPERIWEPGAFEKDECDEMSLCESQNTEAEEEPHNISSTSERSDDGTAPAPTTPASNESNGEDQPQPTRDVPGKKRPHNHVHRHHHADHPHQHYYSPEECSICLQQFQRGDCVRILPCGHIFHKVEVDDWLLKWKKICPVCRTDVTSKPVQHALTAASIAAITPVGETGDEAERRAENAHPYRPSGIVSRFWQYLRPVRERNVHDVEGGEDDTDSDGEETPDERTALLDHNGNDGRQV